MSPFLDFSSFHHFKEHALRRINKVNSSKAGNNLSRKEEKIAQQMLVVELKTHLESGSHHQMANFDHIEDNDRWKSSYTSFDKQAQSAQRKTSVKKWKGPYKEYQVTHQKLMLNEWVCL